MKRGIRAGGKEIFVEFHFYDIDIEKLKENVLDFLVTKLRGTCPEDLDLSLNSTLAKSGQLVSGHVLAAVYRSRSTLSEHLEEVIGRCWSQNDSRQ